MAGQSRRSRVQLSLNSLGSMLFSLIPSANEGFSLPYGLDTFPSTEAGRAFSSTATDGPVGFLEEKGIRTGGMLGIDPLEGVCCIILVQEAHANEKVPESNYEELRNRCRTEENTRDNAGEGNDGVKRDRQMDPERRWAIKTDEAWFLDLFPRAVVEAGRPGKYA